MMTKLEKLVIALTHLAEEATVYLQKMNGKPFQPFQPGLPMGASPAAGPRVEDAYETGHAVEETPATPKKERKPRAPKLTEEVVDKVLDKKAADYAQVEAAATEKAIQDEEAQKAAEKASTDRMMEVTKQWVILAKNDTPKDGKAVAMEMLNGPAFNAAKLGDLSHEQRLRWIAVVEEWIKGHK